MTNLDYAKLMLEIYEDDEPLNIDAINHYREMVVEEEGKEITGCLKDLTKCEPANGGGLPVELECTNALL